jgi:hypothetical protein
MRRQADAPLARQALPRGLTPLAGLLETLLDALRQLPHGVAQLSPRGCALAHERYHNVPLAATWATETPPHRLEVLRELPGLERQGGRVLEARPGDLCHEGEDFFGAWYSVVASVTRGGPWAAGKVSPTRWAGLTSPAAIAAAAWRAIRAALSASSRRPRHSAKGAGHTKCAWEQGAWSALRPQASITATSGRKRWQIASSEAPRAWWRHARATNTRVGTGGWPWVERVGNRGATRHSTAATRVAQGNVSAPGQRGGVAGPKSTTWRRGPPPLNQCGRERTRRLVSPPQH